MFAQGIRKRRHDGRNFLNLDLKENRRFLNGDESEVAAEPHSGRSTQDLAVIRYEVSDPSATRSLSSVACVHRIEARIGVPGFKHLDRLRLSVLVKAELANLSVEPLQCWPSQVLLASDV